MSTRTVTLTSDPIVIPPLHLPGREIGACVEFQGLVREKEGEASLTGLEYEAYESMAVRQMERILDELNLLHGCAEITFIHRLGWVPVGEVSIYIRVLSSHRGEALALCGEAIDRMKQEVPIWKRVRG